MASEIYLDGWRFGVAPLSGGWGRSKIDLTDPNALLSIWKTLRESGDDGDGD